MRSTLQREEMKLPSVSNHMQHVVCCPNPSPAPHYQIAATHLILGCSFCQVGLITPHRGLSVWICVYVYLFKCVHTYPPTPPPPSPPPCFNKPVVIYGCSSSTDGWPNWTQAAASPTCLKKRSQREAFVEVSSARPVNQLATSYLFAIFHAAGRGALLQDKGSKENKKKSSKSFRLPK